MSPLLLWGYRHGYWCNHPKLEGAHICPVPSRPGEAGKALEDSVPLEVYATDPIIEGVRSHDTAALRYFKSSYMHDVIVHRPIGIVIWRLKRHLSTVKNTSHSFVMMGKVG